MISDNENYLLCLMERPCYIVRYQVISLCMCVHVCVSYVWLSQTLTMCVCAFISDKVSPTHSLSTSHGLVSFSVLILLCYSSLVVRVFVDFDDECVRYWACVSNNWYWNCWCCKCGCCFFVSYAPTTSNINYSSSHTIHIETSRLRVFSRANEAKYELKWDLIIDNFR